MVQQIQNDISNFKSSIEVSKSKIEDNQKKYDTLTGQVNTLIDTFTVNDIESLKKSYHKQALMGDLINSSYKLMINNFTAITSNAPHAWRCLESAVQRMKNTQINEAEIIKSKALESSMKSDALKLLNWVDLICKLSRIYLENSKYRLQIHKCEVEMAALSAKKKAIEEKIDLHGHLSDGPKFGHLSSEVD